jgi:hypothetical protein
MGTSTVSGPFRSQNGFQELVNGVWTPVGGGGGGGGGYTFVSLNDDYFPNFTDNRYSDDPEVLSGPTAGTSVILPNINVGESIVITSLAGDSSDVWRIQLPATPGVDISYFAGTMSVLPLADSFYPSAPIGAWGISTEGPQDSVFIYGVPATTTIILRNPNIDYPGFGVLAPYTFVTPLVTFGAFYYSGSVPYNFRQFPRSPFPVSP